MKDDLPVEEAVDETRHYFGHKEIFESYNTHAMRDKDAIEVPAQVEVLETTFLERLAMLARVFTPFRALTALKA